MKTRMLCTVLGVGAVALAWTACGPTTSPSFPRAIPPGAKVFPCNADGDCRMLPRRPLCASQNSLCVNGECAFFPRTYSENPNGYCECYRGQMPECVLSETTCGKASGVATCNVTDDTHSSWNPTCSNLAK
jgi:hypothetical protein